MSVIGIVQSKLSAHMCICVAVPVDRQVDYQGPAFSLGRSDQDQQYGAVAENIGGSLCAERVAKLWMQRRRVCPMTFSANLFDTRYAMC